MYAVFDPITSTVLFNGSLDECQLFLEKRTGYKRFCTIMKAVEAEGDVEPYIEEIELPFYDEDDGAQ